VLGDDDRRGGVAAVDVDYAMVHTGAAHACGDLFREIEELQGLLGLVVEDFAPDAELRGTDLTEKGLHV
jgi:hypothetical protein